MSKTVATNFMAVDSGESFTGNNKPVFGPLLVALIGKLTTRGDLDPLHLMRRLFVDDFVTTPWTF